MKEQTLQKSSFHIMTKPRGAICNLACDYCYFLKKENLYQHSTFKMSDQILEDYTKQYIQANRGNEIVFAWQGGEPTLMGIEFYQKAIAYQQKYAPPGVKISNSIQTNATLIDDEWAQFFSENDFLLGISLDGPDWIHDYYRKDKQGNQTHHHVLQGLQKIKEHHVKFNILTCVNAHNAAYPLTVYRYLRDEIEAEFIQFIPIVERKNKSGYQKGNKVTSRSVSGKAYGRFLKTIFDEWVRQDVGKTFVQLFDQTLGAYLGYPASLCVFDKTCGRALAMEHNGDLYACDHFVEPDYFLGNLQETPLIDLVLSEKQQQFGINKQDLLPKECLHCDVRFACNGGCPKNRLLPTKEAGKNLNYLCEGYHYFFSAVEEEMNLMKMFYQMGHPVEQVRHILQKKEGIYQPPTSEQRKEEE